MALFLLSSPQAHGGTDNIYGADWNELINTLTGVTSNLITLKGGLTMSSSDITLAGNKIKSTNFNLYESGGFNVYHGVTQLLSFDTANTITSYVTTRITSAGSLILDDAGNDYTIGRNGASGFLRFTGSQNSFSGYQFWTQTGGVSTQVAQIANGGDFSVNGSITILTTKALNFNVGGTSLITESANNQLDIQVNSVQGFRLVKGTTTTTENNTVIGRIAALATNSADGFLYMPSGAGTPTGTPTAFTGKVAFYYDTTNNIIYIYNGAWKKTAALT